MPQNDTLLQLLQEKLNYFRREYIIIADPGRKFQLEKEIEDIERQMKQLEPSPIQNSDPTNSEIINLTGTQRKQIREALIDAFPSKNDLKIMLSDELDLVLDVISGGDNYQDVVFELIKWSQAQGRLNDLLEAAKRANPGNSKLRNLNL